jgi:aerobic-type carbon monoxide dehydrogenase small subunit (CoxS/CutS family)
MVQRVTLTVNGRREHAEVEPHRTLLSVLRDELGLTGTKAGCDDSECGACMVLVDGEPVNSCCYLALQAEDRPILTVEGLADEAGLHPLQRAILEQGGAQCGFCTPGVLMSAHSLLARTTSPSEAEIREALSGNLCRCTGYQKIVAAVAQAAAELREAAS